MSLYPRGGHTHTHTHTHILYIYFTFVHPVRFPHLFSGVVERKVSGKVEPTLSPILIIEEGRRGENGSCNIHMSY